MRTANHIKFIGCKENMELKQRKKDVDQGRSYSVSLGSVDPDDFGPNTRMYIAQFNN
jgi:hypothetical protein